MVFQLRHRGCRSATHQDTLRLTHTELAVARTVLMLEGALDATARPAPPGQEGRGFGIPVYKLMGGEAWVITPGEIWATLVLASFTDERTRLLLFFLDEASQDEGCDIARVTLGTKQR